jgi:AcrR family transcriptional regulator
MEHSNITKNHIIKTATELFARYGLKKTTMDEIAENAGIAKGTIYIYFESKENLFVAIVNKEAEEYFQKLESVINSYANPEEKLKAFVHSFFEIIFDYMNLYNVAFNTMSEINNLMPTLQSELEQYYARTNEIIRSILQQGITDGSFRNIEIDLFVDTVKDLIMVIGYPFSPYILQREKVIIFQKIDLMMDLILNGLKK